MKPGSPEWHAERKVGIGASEAAAVLGLSKYASPLDIYLRKTQDSVGHADNAASKRGRRLEPIVLDMYEEDYGAVIRAPERIVSEKYPFMFASLDAERADDGRPVEAKTVGKYMACHWGDPDTDEIPQEYLIQITHQMIVKEREIGDIAALLTLDDFRKYTFLLDAELAGMIAEGLGQFWRRVENREPPPPSTGEDVERLYRRSRAVAVDATPEIEAAYAELLTVRENIRPLAKREAALQDDIKKFLADRDSLLIKGDIAVTWSTAKDSARFDGKRFQSEMPDLYAKYLIQSTGSRRFLLKGEKNGNA